MIVDGDVRKFLPSPAADDRRRRLAFQRRHRRRAPGCSEFTLARSELNEFNIRRQLRKTLIASPPRGERQRRIQFHDNRPHRPSQLDRSIDRSGIDVDDVGTISQSRRETGSQALPFISADGNHAELHDLASKIFAGTPTAVAPAGTSISTTAFAPMLAPSPIVTAPRIFAPAPTFTDFPSLGASCGLSIVRFPSVTP